VTSHTFHPSILREYDIRGVVGKTLSTADARALGATIGTMVRERGGNSVALGQDGRLSSPELAGAVAEGLVSTGVAVKRIGVGPTPMLYFADRQLGTAAGIMVTGSHNPPDYNGFKLVMGHAPVYGETIQQIGKIAASGKFASGSGQVTQHAMLPIYVDRLLQDAALKRPLTIAWDAGNGATGEALTRLCARLPGRHILLNEVIDGTFPAHHPDPTLPETLEQLRAAVRANDCDLGIAFDGDGDRIGVIDCRGRVLWGDQILVLLGAEILQRKPGSTIIADVKASQVLFDEIARLGGNPLMWRTGHSLIKVKMAETGAPLAGEMSGHIFFADGYYGYDDALYAAIRLLNVVAGSGESLSALRDRLPETLTTPELRFPCSEERKFAVVTETKARLNAAKADMNTIDGVRVRTADGWWLLRASNTQDVLVARCEASSPAGLRRLQLALLEQLRKSAVDTSGLERMLAETADARGTAADEPPIAATA
jgi:phosphomannomutase